MNGWSSFGPYLIFVTDTTDGVCGEKIGHVEKFSPWHVVKWKISPHDKCGETLSHGEISPREKCGENLSLGEISPHEKFGDKSVRWKISPHEKDGENLLRGELICHLLQNYKINIRYVQCLMLCCVLCYIVAKSLFYAIYAVLSRNLFCPDLRAFAWRKIGSKFLSVEKNGQISGMG